jgi:hypothetical protein
MKGIKEGKKEMILSVIRDTSYASSNIARRKFWTPLRPDTRHLSRPDPV